MQPGEEGVGANPADGTNGNTPNGDVRPIPTAASPGGGSYNTRNPAVRRLLHEAKELQNATDQFWARPMDDNLFEWHFTIAGPNGCEFEGGLYHGRIIMPADYPLKPPSFILLTPNGRFETNRKICLSISGHHPETWQPSWSIRTALLALVAFLPTQAAGAIGSLEYPAEERKKLAVKSRHFACPDCGPVSGHLLKPSAPATPSPSSTSTTTNTEKCSTNGEESSVKSGNNDAAVTNSQKEQLQSPPASSSSSVDQPLPPAYAASSNPQNNAAHPRFPVVAFPSFVQSGLPTGSNPAGGNNNAMVVSPFGASTPPPFVAAAYLPWMYQSMFAYASQYAHQAAIAAVVAGASHQRIVAQLTQQVGAVEHQPVVAAQPAAAQQHYTAADLVALQQHRERRASAYLFAVILLAWMITRFIDRFFLV